MILRIASLLVATASLILMSGCNSGPHQQPVSTSATTSDSKDAKGNPGPHQ